MATQVIKLGLEFDTKSAIASYRDLISEMSKGGADPKAIKQFTAAIEKAETELAQLAAEGSTGFTDSKGIEQYQKKVLKTVTSMQQLALRMQEFSKSGDNFPTSEVKKLEAEIEKLKKQITDAQKAAKEGLVKSLTNSGGFTKKEAEAIAETVKTQNELIAKLEEEKRLRDEIRKAAEEPAKKAKASIQDKAIAKTTSGSEVVMEAVGMKGKKGVKEAREAVAAAIQQGIRDGWSAEDVKKKAIESLQASNLSDTVKKNIIQGLEAGFDTDTVRKYLDAVDKKVAANPAVKKYNAANESYGKVANGSLDNYSQFITNSEVAAKAQQELADAQSKVGQTAADSTAAQKKMSDTAGQMAGKAEQAADGFIQMSDAQKNSVKSTEQLEGGFNRLADRLKYMFGFTAMFNKLRQIIRSTFNDIQELDKAYASIAYVTNETVGDLWSTYGEYAGMAEKLGQSTADVIKASAIYRQQGLGTAEALELTTDTMKLATIAGNDYSTATQEMTAALRGFKMEMDEGSHVSDVYSELAAHAAASVDDIAQAMSRTASIANSAGMSFENTSAFLTQMIETTQESAENIGTSMKTIIARFTELKENVAGTADSEFEDLSFNKVDEALKSVGVALKDTQGQFRNLDDVFLELSSKWADLDRNTQRYIATVAAGSRQQSRFIALMDNYERTVELIDIAADSEGKADEQFAKAADTIEFKLNAIKTKWEEFKLSLMDSSFVKGLLDVANLVMDSFKNVKMPQVAIVAPFAIAAAKSFVLNFVSGVKKSSQNFKQIGNLISKHIFTNKGKNKIQLELEEKTIKDQMAKIEEDIKLKKQQIESSPIRTEIKIQEGEGALDIVKRYKESVEQTREVTLNTKEATMELARALGYEGDSANEARDYFVGQVQAYQQGTEAIKEQEQALQNRQQKLQENQVAQQKATMISNAARQAINGLTVAVSGYISGVMSGKQALLTFAGAILTTAINLGIQAFSMSASAAISKVLQKQNGKLSLSFIKLAFSELLAEAPLVAILIAATALVAGFALLAGGIALLVGQFNKYLDKTAIAGAKSSQLQKKEEELNKQLEIQKERLSNVTEELKEQQKTYDLLNDSLDDYLDRNGNEKFLASEDADEWLSMQQEIANIMPDLIDHYDEEGNAILKTGQAFKEAYETQKKALQDLKKEEADANFDVAMTNFELSATKSAKNGLYNNLINNNAYLQALTNLSAQTAGRSDYVNETGNDAAVDSLSIGPNGKLSSSDFAYDLTAVGLLEGARANRDVDLGNYIKDALIAAGKDKAFGIEDEDNALQVLDKLADKLTEGDTAQENEMFDIFQEVLKENPKIIEQEKRALLREQKKNEEQLDTAINNLVGANASLVDGYEDASKNVQHIMQAYAQKNLGLDVDTLKQEFNKDWAGKIDENGNPLEEYSQSYYEQFSEYVSKNAKNAVSEDAVKDVLSNFSKDQIAALETFYEEHSDAAASDLIQAMQDDLTISPEVKEAWLAANQDLIDSMVDNAKRIADALGLQLETNEWGEANFIDDKAFTKFYSELGQTGQEALASLLEQIRAESGKEAARQAAFNYRQSTSGLSQQSQNDLLSTDWETYSNLTSGSMKNSAISQIATRDSISKEEAEAAWDAAIALARQSGQIMTETTATSLAAFGRQSDEIEEAFEKNASGISKYLQNTRGQISLTATESKELKAAFDKLAGSDAAITGLDEALGDFDETTGKIILDTDLLREKIKEQTTARLEQLEAELKQMTVGTELYQQTEKEIESLKTSVGYINELVGVTSSLSTQIDDLSENISKASNAISQYQKDGYVSAENLANIAKIVGEDNIWRYVTDDLKLNTEALLDYIDAEITHLEVLAQTDKSHTIELYKLKALRHEMENTRKEVAETTQDLQEKYQQALENLANAQEDVIDKQKSLNEAIQEYNKLLYGSENRQSGLDLLYNYKEAISAFSDEMSRAQELIEDSKSVNDSVAALSRYTNAAHQRLAYMNAQNERYDAGLTARRNQLLGGATSYTNELTGNTTTINFGDYVKYNADTGLIALDQKLIQDAKIADEWKDYIEKQVDDYNKLSMESLKNQDEIRKLEKEIQKRREDAIKKYADFEQDIAETLKEAYQKQVDDLKDRYDSMKEADDDYLNALQEAIEKQRKLRERENKWEDLAQKQKKLALMQRDTSGANTLENQRLQKEIEKDQEAMLDESIDSAIENMQKLAEKQDELRQTEIELKEALIENTMYWNQQAEGVAQGFETAEDYVEWFKDTAEGLNEQTAAQFENTMNEARDKFGGASEEIAWRIQDDMSQTGDAVVETIEITGDEIKNIVASTSDTFIDEVSNTFERTRQSFNANMDSAIEKVRSAEKAYDDACKKAQDAAKAANEAAEALRQAASGNTPGYSSGDTDSGTEEGNLPTTSSSGRTIEELSSARASAHVDAERNALDAEASELGYNYFDARLEQYTKENPIIGPLKDEVTKAGMGFAHGDQWYLLPPYYSDNDRNAAISWLQENGYKGRIFYNSRDNKLYLGAPGKTYNDFAMSKGGGKDYAQQYKEGGLVNYTGPAWVDGTTDHPEAFLSSEDTERIGNAAKLLADIPSLTRSNISTSNQTYGDTNIEINLNIDHISSDVDVDEMLERVKQEIVDVARPIGTNVILQQQV